MTPSQFESQVTALLSKPIASPNDPALVTRLNKLRETFNAIDDPKVAAALLQRLSAKDGKDALSKEFNYKLATAARQELLKILQTESVKPPKPAPAPRGKEYRLVDEDKHTERTITRNDPEYQAKFINHHIKNVTSDVEPNTMDFQTLVIHFDDGRQLPLPMDAVPVRVSIPGYRLVRLSAHVAPVVDHYILRKGTIIPASEKDELLLNASTTPDLVDIRTAIEFNINQRRQLLKIAVLTNTFAGIWAMGASFLHFSMSVSSQPGGMFTTAQKAPPESEPEGNGGPPPATFKVTKQYRMISIHEMMVWEKQGGHTLERHNANLTKKTLLDRVVGEEPLVAPASSNGDPATEFGVWQGSKSGAASKWADQATMNKAISKLIQENIDDIRTSMAGGGEWKKENVAVGFKTGSGWVKGGALQNSQLTDRPAIDGKWGRRAVDSIKQGVQDGNRAVSWDENLNGMTIVIRKRQNHIPTSQDPEGWYVHTAFPDRVHQ